MATTISLQINTIPGTLRYSTPDGNEHTQQLNPAGAISHVDLIYRKTLIKAITGDESTIQKTVLFIIIVFLLFSLSGCGGHGKSNTSAPMPTAAQNQQTTTAQTTAHPAPAPQKQSSTPAPTTTNAESNNNNQTEMVNNDHRWRAFGVSDQPFSPYPTEKQLFDQPDGKINIEGIQANSYGQGMEITWEAKNWGYFAIGHAPADGERIAKDILSVLPETKTLVPGAIKGKLRVAQLGNPIYYTASWTYDGEKWYTLEDRGSAEDAVKILHSINSPPGQRVRGGLGG